MVSQATNQYQIQYWPTFMVPFGLIRTQYVNQYVLELPPFCPYDVLGQSNLTLISFCTSALTVFSTESWSVPWMASSLRAAGKVTSAAPVSPSRWEACSWRAACLMVVDCPRTSGILPSSLPSHPVSWPGYPRWGQRFNLFMCLINSRKTYV